MTVAIACRWYVYPEQSRRWDEAGALGVIDMHFYADGMIYRAYKPDGDSREFRVTKPGFEKPLGECINAAMRWLSGEE